MMLSNTRGHAVGADRNTGVAQHARKRLAGELASLVGVENLGTPTRCQRILKGCDAKARIECVAQFPAQHAATVPNRWHSLLNNMVFPMWGLGKFVLS